MDTRRRRPGRPNLAAEGIFLLWMGAQPRGQSECTGADRTYSGRALRRFFGPLCSGPEASHRYLEYMANLQSAEWASLQQQRNRGMPQSLPEQSGDEHQPDCAEDPRLLAQTQCDRKCRWQQQLFLCSFRAGLLLRSGWARGLYSDSQPEHLRTHCMEPPFAKGQEWVFLSRLRHDADLHESWRGVRVYMDHFTCNAPGFAPDLDAVCEPERSEFAGNTQCDQSGHAGLCGEWPSACGKCFPAHRCHRLHFAEFRQRSAFT